MNVLHYRIFNNFAKGVQGRHFYLNPLKLFPSHIRILYRTCLGIWQWMMNSKWIQFEWGFFYCSLVDFNWIKFFSIIYTHSHGISWSLSHTFSISNSTKRVNLFPIFVVVSTLATYVMDGHSKGISLFHSLFNIKVPTFNETEYLVIWLPIKVCLI